MRLLILPALCLTLLSHASLGQQKVIDVPFDKTAAPGSPFEVTGKVSVQETIAGNEVSSMWEQNVTAKNISDKPIVMLIGILDAVGPHSSGGYGFWVDKFFTEDVIQPEATIPVARGTNFRGDCCINPLGEPEDPEADFRVGTVQFLMVQLSAIQPRLRMNSNTHVRVSQFERVGKNLRRAWRTRISGPIETSSRSGRPLHSQPVVGGLGASNGKLSVEGLVEFGRPVKNYMGVGIAIGVGVGTALGVALHNIPVWVAAGGAFGAIPGFLMNRRNRNSN